MFEWDSWKYDRTFRIKFSKHEAAKTNMFVVYAKMNMLFMETLTQNILDTTYLI